MSVAYRCLNTAEMLEIDGEMIILNPETFTVTKLNESGGELWQLMREGRSEEELAEHLASQHGDVPMEKIREDVRNFLQNLQEIGLIRVE